MGSPFHIPVFVFRGEAPNEVARLIERPETTTEEIEKEMLAVRRATRLEGEERWRQDVVNEIRGLPKD